MSELFGFVASVRASMLANSSIGPGSDEAADAPEQLVGAKAKDADHGDGHEDHVDLEAAHRLERDVAKAAARGDEFGDDEIGPGPAHGDAQHVEHAWKRGRKDDVEHRVAAFRA